MSDTTPKKQRLPLAHAFQNLGSKAQKGSKPRCHLLTSGTKAEVARRLTTLIEPWGEVLPTDAWMPEGFDQTAEAQLHKANLIPNPKDCAALGSWWLADPGGNSSTPNLDVASTCLIGGKRGLLLIEAKAHDVELRNEERGKLLGGSDNKGVSMGSRRNHVRIGACIQDASLALTQETKLVWALSRDWNYQMSNRFTWAWKLTELGIPVILVYLGFLGCEEMREGKSQSPIRSQENWDAMVRAHSQHLFPSEVWNSEWQVHGQSLIPLIRVCEQPLSAVQPA